MEFLSSVLLNLVSLDCLQPGYKILQKKKTKLPLDLTHSNTIISNTGKNNGFPFLDILGYLKNTHKNPKFGKVRQVPTREFPTKFPNWTCLTLPNLGFLWVFFKYPI